MDRPDSPLPADDDSRSASQCSIMSADHAIRAEDGSLPWDSIAFS